MFVYAGHHEVPLFFNSKLHSQTDKVHKLKVITAPRLCLAFIDYQQHITPKIGWRPLFRPSSGFF